MRSWRSSRPSSTSKPDDRRADWQNLARLFAEGPLPRLAAVAPSAVDVALVGGAVRDALLGRVPNDLDLVVGSGFESYLDAIEAERGARPADIGDAFQNTHRFRWKGVQVDVARTQGSLEDDLGRRDFSINAMALPLGLGDDPQARLVDPHGGLADLLAGRLRETAPGVVAADPLRALRAVRYATDLHDFHLVPSTASAVSAVADRLSDVASERVQGEWALSMAATDWRGALRLGAELGVCAPTIGELNGFAAIDAWAAAEVELRLVAPQLRGRLGALILDLAGGIGIEAVVARLLEGRWPPAQVNSAERVARWMGGCGAASPEVLASWALCDPGAATDASALASRLRPGQGAIELQEAARRAEESRWVSGDDLIGWGMSPGPSLGRVLRQLAIGQITRRWPTAARARAWAREHVAGPAEPAGSAD